MCERYEWDDPQDVVYKAPEDGKEYCLFHAPMEHKGVLADEFNAQVFERIQAASDFESDEVGCDLRGTLFSAEIIFDDFSMPLISFDSSRFAERAHFQGVTFERMSSFNGVQFEKAAFFDGAKFTDYTDFMDVSFGGGGYFSRSLFDDFVCFDKACFEGLSMFNGTSFRRATSFEKAHFMGTAFFSFASFHESVDFSKINFEADVNFNATVFNEGGDFIESFFEGNANFVAAQCYGPLCFKSIKTGEEALITFTNCAVSHAEIIFDRCDTACLDLAEQYNLDHFRFIDSPWGKKRRRIRACTEDQEGRLQQTRDLYQRMKAKYKAENNEYEASKWHIAEKEAQLKLLRQNGESRLLCFALWLYRLVSGFGENPVRAFWVLLGVLALPLLVLSCVEVWYHFSWWNFDLAKVDSVFKEWLKFIPLTRAIPTDEPGTSHALMIFWQLLVTLQAALFAFALRN